METFSVLPISQLVAGLALALTFGGMTFFSAVLTPLVFTKLPLKVAGPFIRQVFPWYYLSMGVTVLVALAALLLAAGGKPTWEVALAALVLAGFGIAGHYAAARRFRRLHLVSVVINAFQWLAVLAALIMVLM